MGTFRFKQFAVEQSDVAMKVGTDGVLLGAWVCCASARRVLDIGTGTGVIALMIAQRSEAESITGVDIDECAVRCAGANFDNSPWSSRLAVLHSAVQSLEGASYDLIVSNPPYFVDSLQCPDSRRTVARHTTELTFEALDSSVCRLLERGGRFALILPTEQMERYLSLTALNVVRRCNVHPVAGGAVKRVMVELAAEAVAEATVEDITIENGQRGDYSEQYRSLLRDFYLKF